jgi:hypothetical protein
MIFKHCLIFLVIVCGLVMRSSAQSMVAGEYFIDVDPGVGAANAFPVNATYNELVSLNIPLNGLSSGIHFLGLRVKSSAGKWSHYETRTFYVISSFGLPSRGVATVNPSIFRMDNRCNLILQYRFPICQKGYTDFVGE